MAGKAYCPQCKSETPVTVKPVFEGFEKVGEQRSCTFCGHRFEPGQAPAPSRKPADPAAPKADSLFGEPWTPPKPVNPFGDEPLAPLPTLNPFGGPVELPKAQNPFGDEATEVRICRHCRHYVVNPFTQRCMLHERDVTATDTCPDFTKRR